jgi:tRNA threonylcarbamoyladenosine biosynthesis protein TsaE
MSRFAVRTDSEERTSLLGQLFAPFLSASVVLLSGDLGSGKTVFVRGLCRAFGIERVRSPSFTLLIPYHGTRNVAHIDLYRLDSETDIQDLALDEWLEDGYRLLIEWAERSDFSRFPERWDVAFEFVAESSRSVRFSAAGTSTADALEGFRAKLEEERWALS